jgi:ERCC4-type nuclease
MKTEYLRCDLTEDEVTSKSGELALLHGEAERMQAEFDDLKKVRSARIKTVVTRQAVLAKQVREKAEYRNVEVEDTPNFTEKVMETVRSDTGEIVRTRKLSEEELQRPLPIGKKKAARQKDKEE